MEGESAAKLPRAIAPRASWITWAWVALVFVGCWLPEGEMPVSESRPIIPHMDKAVHFAAFAVFAVLGKLTGALGGRTALIAGAGLLIAATSELGQGVSFVGRDPDVMDVLADSVGILAGVAFAAIVRAIRWPPRPRPRPE